MTAPARHRSRARPSRSPALAALAATLALVLPARADEPAGAPHEALEPASVLPATIDALEVDGPWRTLPWVVTRELPWRAGTSVSAEEWALGLQRLWNMGVFSQVEARLERREGRLVAVLKLEERWTINLIARLGVGGGASWWSLGLADLNTLGRFVETGAYLQRFLGLNGGEAWLRNPRFLDERQELYVIVDRLARPRPGFVQVRNAVRVDFLRHLEETVAAGARLELVTDRLRPVPDGAPGPPDSSTLLAGGILRLGRVDTLRLRQRGQSLEVRPTLGLTSDPNVLAYGHLWLEAFLFRLVGTRVNLAVRAQAGLMTPAPVQSQFYLGGLDLVRGLPDSAIRTRAFVLANVEARVVAFDSTWLAAMPAAFIDGVVARNEAAGARAALTVGAGVRLLIPRFVHSGLRIDYALPLPDARLDGRRPSIGIWQFF